MTYKELLLKVTDCFSGEDWYNTNKFFHKKREFEEVNPLICQFCGSFLPEGIGYKCPNCGASEIKGRIK